MALFKRSRMRKAEELGVRIGENLLRQSLLDPGKRGQGQRELVRVLAGRVCQANPAWRLADEVLTRQGRSGRTVTHLAELGSALDLLGVVIDADLREHGQLPARDHEEVLMRTLRRLSSTLSQHSLCEISESLADELASEELW